MSTIPVQLSRLQDDLRGLLEGEVRCDPVLTQLYATDASMFECRPLGIVCPSSTDDVVAVLQYASEKKIPVHPRGAGTGTVGGALGSGLVLDMTRLMRRMIQADDDSVTVQAGAVRERVNFSLTRSGKKQIGPDGGFATATTIGSLLSADRRGAHFLRQGCPIDHLLELQVVLADGTVVNCRPYPSNSDSVCGKNGADRQKAGKKAGLNAASNDDSNAEQTSDSRFEQNFDRNFESMPIPEQNSEQNSLRLLKRSGIFHPQRGHEWKEEVLVRKLDGLIRPFSDIIEKEQPSDDFRYPGYQLRHILRQSGSNLLAESAGGTVSNAAFNAVSGSFSGKKEEVYTDRFIDLARLFVGSEGTLGIITEAKFKRVLPSNFTGTAMFLFDSLEKAAHAVPLIREFQPSLCELLDRRLLNMISEWDRRFARYFSSETEAVLTVELDSDDDPELNDRLSRLTEKLRSETKLCFASWRAFQGADYAFFLELLEKSEFALSRMPLHFQIISLLNDAQIPISALPEFFVFVQNLFRRYNIPYALSGHIGHGQIRIQPIISRSTLDSSDKMRTLAVALIRELYTKVLSLSGSITSAEGVGLARSFLIPEHFPGLTPLFAKIKKTLDPNGILNPGRIVFPLEEKKSEISLGADDWHFYSSVGATLPWSGLLRKFKNESDFLLAKKTVFSADEEDLPFYRDSENENVQEDQNLSPSELNAEFSDTGLSSTEFGDPNILSAVSWTNSLVSLEKQDNISTDNNDFSVDGLSSDNLSEKIPEKTSEKKSKAQEELSAKAGSGNRWSALVQEGGDNLPRQLELQLKWNPEDVLSAAYQCSDCGRCRTRSSSVRMCPVARFLSREEAVPRAKANLFRGLLENRLELSVLTEELAQIIAENCIFCHSCQLECPSQTDIPKLAYRLKSAYHSAHGLTLGNRILSQVEDFLNVALFFNYPFNWGRKNRTFRWFLSKIIQFPQGGSIPKLVKIPFLTRVAWSKKLGRPSRRSDRKVALFVDTFSNYFDPKLAEAVIRVLEHNGIDVFVPNRQKSSGHTAVSFGNSERAEKLIRQNVAVLSDAVRLGYEIITIEPLSAVCIKNEYSYIMQDSDAKIVADNTTDVCSFLYRLHLQGQLQLNFSPLHGTVGYHVPCRTLVLTKNSVSMPTPAEELLRLIPGLNVQRIEQGCCGFSGVLGLKKNYFKRSLRLGMRLFMRMRSPSIQFASTECNACKVQIEQGSGKQCFHPLKLLAYAYGLTPEFAKELRLEN